MNIDELIQQVEARAEFSMLSGMYESIDPKEKFRAVALDMHDKTNDQPIVAIGATGQEAMENLITALRKGLGRTIPYHPSRNNS